VYNHVISTMPLGCLRMVDLDDCRLSLALKDALRAIQYGASVKIGIQFHSRWWEEDKLHMKHKGGVSTTDRLSRMIVYPSYGIDSSDSATMLVSYSWSQDSLRLGSLIQGHDTPAEKRLVDLVIRDLAKVHDVEYTYLRGLVKDHHAWNWYDSEFAVGAFGFFGPSQYKIYYQEITQPAAYRRLHFAGEASSSNHAWVAGALDSSVRVVLELLLLEQRSDLIDELRREWKLPTEIGLVEQLKQVVAGQDLGQTLEQTTLPTRQDDGVQTSQGSQ